MEEDLELFISRIASEQFLPLPCEVPRDDSEEWDHLTWEDLEPEDAALKRVWSGYAAEILLRDFARFQSARMLKGTHRTCPGGISSVRNRSRAADPSCYGPLTVQRKTGTSRGG